MTYPKRLAVLTLMATVSSAQAWESGQELSEVIFENIDTTGNGALDNGEISDMSESIAFSADSDGDEQITLDEFTAWDFGFAFLAENEGGGDTFAAVKRVMFAVADLDGDGAIDAREWRLNTRWNFERADLDGDALLTEDEFLTGWTPIVMLKAGRGL
ncbi:MAG: signal transduction protein [Pseudomonadota bacterium]